MTSNIPKDYRESHLHKGSDYDSDLSVGDINTYMAYCETRLLRTLVPQLFPQRVPRYLDFACGTGRVTQVIEPMAVTSLGVDVSPNMLKQARQKCQSTQFIRTDITQAELAEEVSTLEPVDLITAFRFFGNAQDELRTKVLRRLHGLLKPGGYLIINNHRNPYASHELLLALKGERPKTDLSYWKLKNLYQKHGLRIRRVIGIGLWVIMHRLRERTMQRTMLHVLEPLSRLPYLGRFCPDSIVVAQAVEQ